MEEHGPSAVRMQDIAAEAGISRQGVYLHFKSRTELLLSLVEWIDREQGLGKRVRRVWNAPDSVTAIKRFMELNAHYTHKIYSVSQSLMSGRYSDDAIAAAWEDRMQGRRTTCRKLIQWLHADGLLTDAVTMEEASDMLWTMISVQVWEQLIIESGWSEEQYQKHLFRTLNQILVSS